MSRKCRLMLVDDEALARERLRYGLALEQNGYEVVAEAEDGEEALELLEQIDVDIVMTDIVMPRMDGLEMTKRLRQKSQDIPVVILSNYEEFEFARKAVSLGASGYLLKVTVTSEELLALLDQISGDLQLQQAKTIKEIDERHHFMQSISVLRKQYLLDVLSCTFTSEQKLASYCDYLQLYHFSDWIAVAIVHIDHHKSWNGRYDVNDQSLFKFALMKMAEELANQRCRSNMIPWTENQFILIMHWNRNEYYNATYIHDFLYKDIAGTVKQYLPYTVSVAASRIIAFKTESSRLKAIGDGMAQAVEEAHEALKQKFYAGTASINCFDSIREEFSCFKEEDRNQYRNLLFGLNPEKEETALADLIRSEIISPIASERVQPGHLIHWLERVTQEVCRSGIPGKESFTEFLLQVESPEDAVVYLVRLVKASVRFSGTLIDPATSNHVDIKKALDYISEHYESSLNIYLVSEFINISSNYFSYLFKKETGVNFSDYVTEYRIRQSKRLLIETTLQVQEIAAKIGIHDYKYFAKLFRKLTGQTPSEYRKKENS